jgi:hypothetical protein
VRLEVTFDQSAWPRSRFKGSARLNRNGWDTSSSARSRQPSILSLPSESRGPPLVTRISGFQVNVWLGPWLPSPRSAMQRVRSSGAGPAPSRAGPGGRVTREALEQGEQSRRMTRKEGPRAARGCAPPAPPAPRSDAGLRFRPGRQRKSGQAMVWDHRDVPPTFTAAATVLSAYAPPDDGPDSGALDACALRQLRGQVRARSGARLRAFHPEVPHLATPQTRG